MSSSGFSIVIAATDRASATIDGIDRRLAGMRAPVDRLQKSMSKFANVSGLSAVAGGFSKIGQTALGAMRSLMRVLEPLAAITSALSLAGMFRMVQVWGQWGSQLGFAAQRMGVTAGQLQALQGAATLAGASSGSLTSGLQNLGQTMYDAVGGRAPEAVALFNQLGVSFSDGKRHARSITAVLPELADKIAAMKDPFTQARVATMLFGGAAEDLLPFLRKGSAGIAEYTAKATAFGVMNQAGIEAANRMRESYAGVSLAVSGLTNSISEKLAPVLSPLLDQVASWIALNRQWIASWIGDKVQQLATYLKSIDWAGIGARMESMWHTVNSLAQSFGGWKVVLEGMIALKIAAWAGSLLGALNPVTGAVLALTLAYIANAAAYDDFINRRKIRKNLDGETKTLQDKFNAMTPEKQAQFNELQAKSHMPTLVPGGAPNYHRDPGLDAQRRVAHLPTSIWPTASADAGPTVPSDWKRNNPGNIRAGNGFRTYATLQDGTNAMRDTLAAYQGKHGLDTIRGIIHRYAPSADGNNEAAYVANVARWTGFKPDQDLDQAHNPTTMAALLRGMSREEQHQLPEANINAAVADNRVASSGGGSVDVKAHIQVSDDRVKTTAGAKGSGSARAAPPKVETSPVFATA